MNDDTEIIKQKLFDDVNLSHKKMKRLTQNGYTKMDHGIIHHLMNKKECKIKNINQMKLYLYLYKQTKGYSGRNEGKVDMDKIKLYTGFTYKKINYNLNVLATKEYIEYNKKEKVIRIITDFPVKEYKKINKGFVSIPDYLLYSLVYKDNGIDTLYGMMIILYCIKMVLGYRQTKNENKVYYDNDGKKHNDFKRKVIGDYQKTFYLKDGGKSINEYTGITDKNIYITKKSLIQNNIISVENDDITRITFNIDIRKGYTGDLLHYHLKEKNCI